MTKKTKFPRTFRDEYQNWSLLAIIEIKTKLKLTYAVYLRFLQALLNIWAMCSYFILHLHIIYTFDFYYTKKWPKRGTNSKNPKEIFLFYRMQIYRIFTESTQATNKPQKCLWCYFLLRCHHKVSTLK